MKKTTSVFLVLVLALSSFIFSSCSVSDAITNAQRLQFKLGNVSGFNIAGIGIGDKKSLTDINVLDAAKIVSAFSSGKLPTSFTLNLIAKNPDDGTGGAKENNTLIRSLGWKLLIDDVDIINGNISQPITIPGVGKETVIPIEMGFDLLQYFKGDGYDKLMSLAFAIGGKSGSSARLKLKIKPTIDTFLGPFTYPGELTVIDKEFRSK